MMLIEPLAHAFRGLDLRRKISATLLAGALAIGGLATLAAYSVARHYLAGHATELLTAKAKLEQREIELRLSGALALAESLASNSVTANALADSRGRETYLDPLLRNQAIGIDGASLTVVDYRGRLAATSAVSSTPYLDPLVFRRMLDEERAAVEVVVSDGAETVLLAALPIRYRLTGNVEGGVLLRVPLAPLLGQGAWADSRRLETGAGRLLSGSLPEMGAFEVSSALDLPPPLDVLRLRLVVTQDRDRVFSALDVLLAIFTGIGLVVAVGVVAFSYVGAHYILSPLRQIAAAAEEIVASGRPVARLPVERRDEFGRLAAAFNTMVDRLRESYGELEDLVAERTRDYEESQQEAERVSKLLREAVQSIAVGFTIFDENDRLVMCNEAYLGMYGAIRERIVPGALFSEIVRMGVEAGLYGTAIDDVEAWVAYCSERHREASGQPIELALANGRWLLIIEHRTPSGYVVGNRIDITELRQATDALRVREAYQRATLDNLPFFFWLKDEKGRFLAVNKVFSDACGQPGPDAVVGLTDFDVWPRELAEAYVADDLAVMDCRQPKAVEERVAGGSEAGWIETYKKPVILGNGRVIGTVGFARDISERKRMEQALEESEQRFELAVTGANDGIWDWNTGSGQCYFSERWKSMLGYRVDEIADDIEEWRSRVHPDDLERVIGLMAQHLSGKTELYSAELRLRCKDGSYKWILCRGRAKFDETGNPVRMSGSHTDISDRREAEAHIRDRNEQLNAIFALSPDGFVSFDAARRVKYASPAFHRMTGIDEATIAGLDEVQFSSLLANACIEQARFPGIAALRESQCGDDEGNRAESIRRRRQLIEMAGAGKRVLEVGIRLSQAESVSQILYFRDVTHESEVDRLKSEFLSTAAHELRTPMASIFGFSELMLAQEFDRESQREYLGAIYRQAALMVSIINELLDLARIEARRGKDFVFRRVDACALLREVVASFKAPPGRRDPLLSLPEGPAWLRADAGKLTQAIGNVLSNAYKYSPDGGDVQMTLLAEQPAANGAPRVGIRIADSGIGMTPAQLARVCERFYRADASGKIPGTGLGMSIVQEIVELHGGQLVFESQPGVGTTVMLWFPAMAAETAVVAAELPV